MRDDWIKSSSITSTLSEVTANLSNSATPHTVGAVIGGTVSYFILKKKHF